MLDRRRKLTDEDREDVKVWHRQGTSIHEIARTLGVNKRLIQFILFPERHVQNKILRAERGGSKVYYVRKKHTLAMRRHRAYKRKLATAKGTDK
jgi:IS30 family transposase